MGFTSQDDLINQISVNGKFDTVVYQKTTVVAGVAGTWTDCSVFNGNPVVDPYAGSTLTFYPTNESNNEAIKHGGNVANATKHFVSAGASCFAATGGPWVVMCVDQLGYIPILTTDCNNNNAVRTVTMTAFDNNTRYPNGNGVRAYFSCNVAATNGGPNLTSFIYTNSANTANKNTSVVSSFTATPVAGQVLHSGSAANRYGPFVPLAAGDTGIKDVETFILAGGTAYTGSPKLLLHLVKPLWLLPIPASGIHAMVDFVNALPSLPRIVDGAHIKFLLYQTAATNINSPLLVNFDYAYGG